MAVSRAPISKIQAFKERMGWKFNWVSSYGSDFNYDYHVSFTPGDLRGGTVEYNYRPMEWSMSEAPGISVFYKDADGKIYHTYSTYERGLDMLNVAYHYMDLVPKGRDEGNTGVSWLRRHDEYEE